MKEYEPELGQAVFGQPWQQYGVSEYVTACLRMMAEEIDRVMWNNGDKAYENPFSNTGNSLVTDVFRAHAYSWNDDVEQPYNFKYGNIEISWYKYLGRGMSANKQITPDEAAKMLDDCLASIRALEKDHFAR